MSLCRDCLSTCCTEHCDLEDNARHLVSTLGASTQTQARGKSEEENKDFRREILSTDAHRTRHRKERRSHTTEHMSRINFCRSLSYADNTRRPYATVVRWSTHRSSRSLAARLRTRGRYRCGNKSPLSGSLRVQYLHRIR